MGARAHEPVLDLPLSKALLYKLWGQMALLYKTLREDMWKCVISSSFSLLMKFIPCNCNRLKKFAQYSSNIIHFCFILFCFHCNVFLPIVVRRVPAKKMDWPNVQLGSDMVTFLVADTPLLVAMTMLAMNFSNSTSEKWKLISIKSIKLGIFNSSNQPVLIVFP